MNNQNNTDSIFYDLSQPVFDHCPGWPTYEPTCVKLEASHEKDNFQAEQIRLNSHTGTHIDSPFHFFKDGITIDKMDLKLFQGNAIIVNLQGKKKPAEGIVPEDFEPYDSLITKDSIVLINTGWCHIRTLDKMYCNDWPYITKEAAEYLKDKGIKGVGTDCMSIGGWYEGTGRPSHEVLLNNNIWAIEEVNFPKELMQYKECYLMAFPIKLLGFSGAPARVVARVDK